MNEYLTQAQDLAAKTGVYLQAAIREAGAVEALALMPMISKAYELEHQIQALITAREQDRSHPMNTLQELVSQHSANAIVLADDGNGSSRGLHGVAVDYDDEIQAAYGDVPMNALGHPHISEDGMQCLYASDWITVGEGDNPYRVRIYF